MTNPVAAALAASIAANYGCLQCLQCAQALSDALRAKGIGGLIHKLYVGSRPGWLFVADPNFVLPFPMPAGETTISQNGSHYGVEVAGVVYDNVFRGGIPLADWEQAFVGAGGILPKLSTHAQF